jgi:SAM-dependent methyltransferase
MREFWDAKARENATYYISSYRDYDDQDDEEFWKWGRILAERFLHESGIPFTGEETVLDLGCGIGRMTKTFAERFAKVHGVDVSVEMITRGRESLKDYPNVELSAIDGTDLAMFDAGTFDFTFSYIVLQHIPDRVITLNYIREFGRVLKPGGHAYFQVNNMTVGWRSRLKMGTRIRRLLRPGHSSEEPKVDAREDRHGPTDLDHPAWVGSRISLKELRDACAAGGMKIQRLRGRGTQYLWVLTRKV